MVDTIKFSEFTDGGTLASGDVTVGLSGGSNARFTSSTQFQLPGTTAERPDPATDGMIRYNTDLSLYEFYNGTIWTQFEDSADIALLIARLAAHTVGDGASMIGLEDQGAVSNKTVQDLAEADFIVKSVTSSLANAIALSGLSTGILVNETGTGNLVARTITGTTDQVDVADGTGLSGNPTLSIASNPTLPGSSHVIIPFGTTAQRPGVPSNGYLRYNTDLDALEYYDTNAAAWVQPSTSVPGGTNGELQYNSSGSFAGDSITTDGAGNWTGTLGLTGQLNVDNVRVDGNSISSTSGAVTIDPVSGQAFEVNTTGGAGVAYNFTGAGNFDVNLGSGLFVLDSTTGVDRILDEDNMVSNSATALATQQSIKAYVDSVGGGLVDSVTGTANQIDVDNTDAANPVLSLSATLVAPGTVTSGNLSLDTNTISSTDTAGDIIITPDTTGDLVLDGLKWPQADGTSGQALITDGAGQTSWSTISGGGGNVAVGTLFYYGGTSAPAGALVCDGSAVSRTTYSELFTAIGETWGAGDGSTTFNLPNGERRVLVGSGGTGTGTLGNSVGDTGGAETVTLVSANMPNGTPTNTANSTGINVTNNTGIASYVPQSTTNYTDGTDTPVDIIQPSAVGLLCIAYQPNAVSAATAASQAEMEAATSNTVFSTPGRQQLHPGHPKAWVRFNGAGTLAINDSYNVTSVTDEGTGDYTVNFTTAFADTDYAAIVLPMEVSSSTVNLNRGTPTVAVGGYRFQTGGTSDNQDSAQCSCSFFGDQ